jgi:hypothetical protein
MSGLSPINTMVEILYEAISEKKNSAILHYSNSTINFILE